jgi:Adaptive response protein AidB N-terminal domain/Acyl-CoA dehydrogenase, C-terminal domain
MAIVHQHALHPARAVLNQPPPLEGVDTFALDLALREGLEREGGGWGARDAHEAGAIAGSAEARAHGRATLFMLWSGIDAGVMCPVSMTHAAVPALRDGAPELAARWEPAQSDDGLSCFLLERGPGMEFQRLKDKQARAAHAAEALECFGGNGYVEDSGMPLLLRDSPLNSIWGGSGNVAALDVRRAIAREPAGAAAFVAECELARGADRRLDGHLDALRGRLGALASLATQDARFAARSLVEDLALGFQGSLLVRHAPAAVADGFCAGRLGGHAGRVYGTLPPGTDARAILARAYPA